MKKKYWIFKCPKCGHYTYSKSGVKSKKCPFCNKTFKIIKYTVAESVNDAIKIVRTQNNRFYRTFAEGKYERSKHT